MIAKTDIAGESFSSLVPCLDSDLHRQEGLALLTESISALLTDGRYLDAYRLEGKLLIDYLSHHEVENTYNEIYGAITKAYEVLSKTGCSAMPETEGAVLFVIHTPYFLAHVDCLFQLLSSRFAAGTPYRERVFLLVLGGSNPTFSYPWKQIGVEVLPTDPQQSPTDIILQLTSPESILRFPNIVWVCTPLGLPLASAKREGINWWSLKMHPTMPEMNKRVTGPINNMTQFSIFGQDWIGFSHPVKYLNSSRSSLPFEERDMAIGAFCREQLIDDEEYWRTIALALFENKGLSFLYAGKKAIHEKWVEKFGIPHHQVSFLGWLASPEDVIRRMRAIIDPWPLGHGLMLGEAINADVPVIFHSGLGAAETPFRKWLSIAKINGSLKDTSDLLSFGSDEQFLKVLESALCEGVDRDRACIAAKAVINVEMQGWPDFTNLITDGKGW